MPKPQINKAKHKDLTVEIADQIAMVSNQFNAIDILFDQIIDNPPTTRQDWLEQFRQLTSLTRNGRLACDQMTRHTGDILAIIERAKESDS